MVDEADTKVVNVSWNPDFDGKSPILQYLMQCRMVPSGVYGDKAWVTLLFYVYIVIGSILISIMKM